jgi:O-antigen ligase
MINKLVNMRFLEDERDKRSASFLSAILLLLLVILALSLGLGLGYLDSYTASLAVLTFLCITLVIALRKDELTAVLIIAVHLYVDWYLGLKFVGLALTVVLLTVLFLSRSPQQIWAIPRTRWLWLLFLCLAIFPALHGYTLSEGFTYYVTVFLAAFLFFWSGLVIAQNITSVRRFLKLLAALSAILALHTLIQSKTGFVLLASANVTQYLEQVSNYQLFSASGIIRAGSFFINPDWNGTFFATMLFIPIGLFIESSSSREKLLYGVETLLMILGLLASYSTGAWIASIVALLVFLTLLGNMRSRLLLLSGLLLTIAAIVVLFPAQIGYQLRHITANSGFALRFAAWQTAIRVIQAFPLTGLGLGLYAYLYRAEPFRSAAQYMKLAHPHNSYLEIGAMAGLPVLFMFTILLLVALWCALRNWQRADTSTRSLFAGSIAAIVALSVNSFSINGWTLAPLAALGWLILGIISSPLVAKSLQMSQAEHQSGDNEGTPSIDEKDQVS